MVSSFERSGMVIGGLLLLASFAVGAGSAGWEPGVPGAETDAEAGASADAPTLPTLDTAPDADVPAAEAGRAAPDARAAHRVAGAAVTAAVPSATPGSIAATGASNDAEPLLVMEGSASWYADALAGRRTASGEPYDPSDLIAAHRALPFGTRLRVTNLTNDRSVEVRVIDRGPFIAGRVLDLSRSAAQQIGMIRAGHARVRIEVLEYGS